MSELTDFLLAQIAADEAVARAAADDGYGAIDWAGESGPTDVHIARHDPARVLAECAAKRRIVEACREDYEYTLGRNDDTTEVAEEVLYALASVYVGADGWREEWA